MGNVNEELNHASKPLEISQTQHFSPRIPLGVGNVNMASSHKYPAAARENPNEEYNAQTRKKSRLETPGTTPTMAFGNKKKCHCCPSKASGNFCDICHEEHCSLCKRSDIDKDGFYCCYNFSGEVFKWESSNSQVW